MRASSASFLAILRVVLVAASSLVLAPACGDDDGPAEPEDASAGDLGGRDTGPRDMGVSDLGPATPGPDDEDTGPDDAGPIEDGAVPITCDMLGGFCHTVGSLSPELMECHEGGHEADPVWCEDNLARCYALCADALLHHDGGLDDGGHHDDDAGHHDDDAGQGEDGGGHHHEDAGPPETAEAIACRLLGSHCHSVDPGTGPLHDCHDGAHDGDPVWCAANVVTCYDQCTAARRDAGLVETTGGATEVACRLLGSYCHSVDPGTGPLHDCHEGAHDADPTWCAANIASCYAMCTEARGAASADGGLSSADGGH